MKKNKSILLTDSFIILTRATFTLLTFTSFYILCSTINMMHDAHAALREYHSVPIMTEYVLGGIFSYLIFALIFSKVFPPSVYD